MFSRWLPRRKGNPVFERCAGYAETKEEMARADADKALRVMSYAEFEQMVQYHVAFDGQYDYIFAENCRVLLKSRRKRNILLCVGLSFAGTAQRSGLYRGECQGAEGSFYCAPGSSKGKSVFVAPAVEKAL